MVLAPVAVRFASVLSFPLRRRLSLLLSAILLLCSVLPCAAQEPGLLALKATPFVSIPLMSSANLYSIGGGATLDGSYIFRENPLLFARVSLGYDILPTRADTALQVLEAGGDFGLHFAPLPKLFARLFGGGGYCLGMYEGDSGGNPFFGTGAEMGFRITPSFTVGLGAAYRHILASGGALYQGLNASLSGAYTFGLESGRSYIEIPEIRLDPVFPVFYKYYDTNPLGTLTLRNAENGPISDVRVSMFVKQYMEKPRVCGTIGQLKRLQEVSIPLQALFTKNIQEVTEGTKVTAEFTVEYTYLGKQRAKTQAESLTVHDRNAMTWDDDRKATSFVSARDRAVLLYAHNVTSVVRRVDNRPVNETFRAAMGIFEFLGTYGVSYVPDTKTPFTENYQNKQSIDYLNFPAETLYFKGGDCDDLSILVAALYEAVGIKTAFITVPGHIYIAFDLGMTPAEARSTFQRPEDLIFADDGVWLPVEVTEVRSGFVKAWQLGAKQWRENVAKGAGALYPVRDGWKIYEPVASDVQTDKDKVAQLADYFQKIETDVERRYRVSLERFVENEIAPQVKRLREQLQGSNDQPGLRNKLGVLYARYGLLNQAEAEFKQAVARTEHTPSLLNLGNLYFMRGDHASALEYYLRAQKRAPDNPTVLLAIARAQYELEDLAASRQAYARLQQTDPQLAARFAYLGEGSGETSRASSSELRETVVWGESP